MNFSILHIVYNFYKNVSFLGFVHYFGICCDDLHSITWRRPPPSPRGNSLRCIVNWLVVTWSLQTIVPFIRYFGLLVFCILVTLVAWFSFWFVPPCPSCLAKCKLRFLYFHNFVGKNGQKPKRKMGWTKTFRKKIKKIRYKIGCIFKPFCFFIKSVLLWKN